MYTSSNCLGIHVLGALLEKAKGITDELENSIGSHRVMFWEVAI